MSLSQDSALALQTFIRSKAILTTSCPDVSPIFTSYEFPKDSVKIMKQRRGPYSKAVCQAAAILAHQCASGASGLTTVAPTDQTPGAVSLHGVVIYVPRTEWPDLQAGPDLLGVAVKSFLPKGTSERHWDVIFPLDADDQVFEFSESRLFHFLELHQTSLPFAHSPASPRRHQGAYRQG